MSLQAHTLAICATGALIEALPEWVRVEMEPHEPLDLAEDDSCLLVAVYVGDERSAVEGRRWTSADTVIELVVQVVLPPVVRATLGGTVCEFDTRRGGTRPLYALVHEAMRRAFTAPAPGTWGELLQAVFVGHPEPLTGMPGRAERPGGGGKPPKPPVPVIDYAIPCSVISPPVFGQSAPYPWPDIVAEMRAGSDFTPAEADFLEALIAGGPMLAHRAELALAGLSARQGVALGLGAVEGLDETPPGTRFTIGTPRGDIVVEAGGE